MSFDFINPLMLIGLAGVSLPILAHLLSKKKYDVVQWGAMQFLELGRNTRRKIRLEEFLLLLLRMGLIALIAVALSRPWVAGGWLTNLVSTQSRDVVLVVDGSYSMGWEGKAVTPHAAAIQWAHSFLEELRPGDTVTLIDAREQVRPVIESPTYDFELVRQELTKLPPPAGSGNLAEAAARGVQLLSRTSNLARDVIVLTDGQARGWSADDANLWTRFDDLRQQPSVEPRVWVVDADGEDTGGRINFSVDRLQLSRELTVAEFPVRIKTKVRYSGGEVRGTDNPVRHQTSDRIVRPTDSTPVSRRVYFEVNGQRLSEKTLTVQLQPDGEASVEFEHRFPSAGSHVVSVVLDDDNLPGDNRADAALKVDAALPVLLLDGDPQLDSAASETFFAKAALSAASNETPWVRATVLPWDQFGPAQLDQAEVVVLANVPRFSEAQAVALKEFAKRGGGLLIAVGDKVDADAYNRLLHENGDGVLPAKLESIEKDSIDETQGTRAVNSSLELPWMTRFRSENDGGFTEARFIRWWKVTLGVASGEDSPSPLPLSQGERGKEDAAVVESDKLPRSTAPVVAARFRTGDPLLVVRRLGRGGAVLMTSSLDADWSTFPAKPDYVSLLHELIFHLAAGRTVRNVEVGTPLVFPVPSEIKVAEYAFFGPDGTEFSPQQAGDESRPLVRLDDTRLPGVYTFQHKGGSVAAARVGGAESAEHFVVDFDRGESDLKPLDEAEHTVLAKEGRLTFLKTIDELKQQMFTDNSRTEFWHVLLLVFLAILVGEVVMTRRLVKGGHAVVEDEAEAAVEA